MYGYLKLISVDEDSLLVVQALRYRMFVLERTHAVQLACVYVKMGNKINTV